MTNRMRPAIVPPRTREQRLAALQYANDVRIRRAELKRRLADGEERADQLIREPPPWAATMRVEHVLEAIPRIGPTRSGRMLSAAQASPRKTLGGLTVRQRDMLIRLIIRGGP